MLRHNGKKIGDSLEVTFMGLYNALETHELINGRRALLAETSKPARAGDRCRVRIVGELAEVTYFLEVEAILEAGDGEKSYLQKVLLSIGSTAEEAGIDVQGALLEILEFEFRNEPERHVEILLDVLENFVIEFWRRGGLPDYQRFSAEIKRVVNLRFADPVAEARYFLRAAEYCAARKEGVGSSNGMLEELLLICESYAGDLVLKSLPELSFADGIVKQTSHGQPLAEALRQKCVLRICMAKLMLQEGSVKQARKVVLVLEPIYDTLRKTQHFADVARLLGEAFRVMQREAVASWWFELANGPNDLNQPVDPVERMSERFWRLLPPMIGGFVVHLTKHK